MTLFWVLLVAIAEHMCLPFRMYPLWRQWQPSTKHRAEQSRASSTCWCGGEAENLLVGFGLGWPLQGATFTSKKHLGLVLIISHVQLQVQSIVYLFWMQPLVHCDKSWHHHFPLQGCGLNGRTQKLGNTLFLDVGATEVPNTDVHIRKGLWH
jgi:hypothetical protein